MKTILIVTTFLIAATAQAENPRLDYPAICNGIKLQTRQKIDELQEGKPGQSDKATPAEIQAGLRILEDRKVILTEFCGAGTKEHTIIAEVQAHMESLLGEYLSNNASKDSK